VLPAIQVQGNSLPQKLNGTIALSNRPIPGSLEGPDLRPLPGIPVLGHLYILQVRRILSSGDAARVKLPIILRARFLAEDRERVVGLSSSGSCLSRGGAALIEAEPVESGLDLAYIKSHGAKPEGAVEVGQFWLSYSSIVTPTMPIPKPKQAIRPIFHRFVWYRTTVRYNTLATPRRTPQGPVLVAYVWYGPPLYRRLVSLRTLPSPARFCAWKGLQLVTQARCLCRCLQHCSRRWSTYAIGF
jgi:hypothetical protein